MALDDNEKVSGCPKQAVDDVQDSCGPCGSTACEAEEDAGCDTCG